MINRILSLLLLISVAILGCSRQDQQTASDTMAENTVDIPALLPRPASLQQALEWDRTQSGYMQMAAKLRTDDPYAVAPRITIAKIFVNEARVTGEHGHYYPAALKMLDEALRHNAGQDRNQEFDALATKAGVQLSQHDFEAARKTALAAIAINPHNAQVYGALVDANVELGRYEEAVKTADKMVSIRPDLRSYSRVSYLREIHGDVEGSIAAMQDAVKAGYPGYESTAWARLTLGGLYERYDQPQKAMIQYEKILEERPNYPFALAALANLKMESGDYRTAEQLLDSATAIIPEVGFYVQLAELYQKTGRDEKFNATIDEIMLMLQDDVDSGHNMDFEYASLYRELLDKPEKAMEYARKEYNKRPENIDVNRFLALLYAEINQPEKATEHLTKAQVTGSRHPEIAEISSQINS